MIPIQPSGNCHCRRRDIPTFPPCCTACQHQEVEWQDCWCRCPSCEYWMGFSQACGEFLFNKKLKIGCSRYFICDLGEGLFMNCCVLHQWKYEDEKWVFKVDILLCEVGEYSNNVVDSPTYLG